MKSVKDYENEFVREQRKPGETEAQARARFRREIDAIIAAHSPAVVPRAQRAELVSALVASGVPRERAERLVVTDTTENPAYAGLSDAEKERLDRQMSVGKYAPDAPVVSSTFDGVVQSFGVRK